MAFEFIQESLAKRRQQHLLRKPVVVESSAGAMVTIDGCHYLNFSGNDYLGQRQSPEVMRAWVEGIGQYGVGSGASPLVTGHTRAHQNLQDYLAEHLQRDSAILFNSGFAANQAITQALFYTDQRKDRPKQPDKRVICDKLMHASFIEGAKHCGAQFQRFKHNDSAHLKTLINSHQVDTLVATEGVFSMDGDAPDLSGLQAICERHQAWLMVDDAHGLGVKGKTGLGSLQAANLNQAQVPIVMGTFGKALGTAGAFIAGSDDLISHLQNFSKHYIYSTAMPPALASATLASFEQIADGEKQAILNHHISRFRSLCTAAKIEVMPSDSAIQPVVIGNPEMCIRVSEKLRELGLWISAIRYPTVPKHTDRLRITLSASHHESDIEALVDALELALQSADLDK